MNTKIKQFAKNFSYTFGANLISTAISTLIILVVPKLFGEENYSYWQLYSMYISYISLFNFGLQDGMYIRYGGKEYDELDKPVFASQYWTMMTMQLIMSAALVIVSSFIIDDPGEKWIIIMTCVCGILVNPRTFVQFVLQATNRFKLNAQVVIMERVLFCVFIVAMLVLGGRNFKLLIACDLVSKLVCIAYISIKCRDIVFTKLVSVKMTMTEVLKNVNVGIKLMLSTVSALLVNGIIQRSIVSQWDMTTFGKVAFTISISNLLMIFINAVALVLFPVLKKSEEKDLPVTYINMRNVLMAVLLAMLAFYYPVKTLLAMWLPKYAESMRYMAILFPMCLYESKTSLLIVTYLKTYRKEKLILLINASTVALSALLAWITVFLMKNLTLAVMSIFVLLAFKCILGEVILSKIMKINTFKDIFIELLMSAGFICAHWFIDSWLSPAIYVVGYAVYILVKKRDIERTFGVFKNMLSANKGGAE